MQHTLAEPFTLSGVTLHQGVHTRVCVLPAPANHGRVFARIDLPDVPRVPARATQVRTTTLSTELAEGQAAVRTVEHLLAALYGMGIDNCSIEVDGPELPILDGSARPYTEAIQRSGRVAQQARQPTLKISEPVTVVSGDRSVMALPTSEAGLRLSYAIDFAHAEIGSQWYSLRLEPAVFASEVAPARTFTLLEQVEYLRTRGLIQGGSLECALVLGPQGWLTPPAWPDEPVRHKLLDLVGDLSLTGLQLEGHIIAYKAGHDLHSQLAGQLIEQYERNYASLR